MSVLCSLFAGVLFGIGLLVSGLADPRKVLAFLDLAGAWDPSLMLVMAGAISVAMPAFAVARKRRESFLGLDMKLPSAQRIDRRLMAGSVLFGIGWGIAGLCPGPALVAVGASAGAGAGDPKALVFFLAMLAGMAMFECLERLARHRAERADAADMKAPS